MSNDLTNYGVSSKRTMGQHLAALSVGLPNVIDPPEFAEGNNEVVQALSDEAKQRVRFLQNVSTTRVYVGVKHATVNASAYHFILEPASDADQGNGGFVNLSDISGDVYVFGAAAFKVLKVVTREPV